MNVVRGFRGRHRAKIACALLFCGAAILAAPQFVSAQTVAFEITGPFADVPIWGRHTDTAIETIAQKYIPETNQTICAVEHKIARFGANPGSANLTIHHGGVEPGAGTLIATSSILASALPANTVNFTAFTLSSCVSFAAGEVYWFVWGNSGPQNTGFASAFRNSNQFANTSYWQFQPFTIQPYGWNEYANREWAIRLIGPAITNPEISELKQFEKDGTTPIPENGTTTKRTVSFSARIESPTGKKVRLEVEARELFLDIPNGTSSFVDSGMVATTSVSGFMPGDYHWRARAIDEDGNASDWLEFGSAATPDFRLRYEPVIIVPGIAGSNLYAQGDNLIWPDTVQMFTNINDEFISSNLGLDSEGHSLQNIYSLGVVDELRLSIPVLGIDLQISDVFKSLTGKLSSEGYANNESYFYFPYDWRLNLDETKNLLQSEIERIKIITGFEKVNIIAHSMGGLLTKDYINTHGTSSIDKLIFVGTPHLGAPKAAKVLLEGDRFGIPWLEEDRIQEIAVNAPAVYELLPNQIYFDGIGKYIKPYFGNEFYDYAETKTFLLDEDVNAAVFDQAENFFAKELHNIDLAGVDAYNIAGCKLDTQSAYQLRLINNSIGYIGYSTGDETVPLGSASYISIPTSKKFYAQKASHSELPSVADVRNAIANILLDESIQETSRFNADQSSCEIRGKIMTWRSPVEVHIYDAQNRHTGLIENNAIEYGIPGVDYEIVDGEKFVSLPTDEGEEYRIIARGEEEGTFDLLVSDHENGVLSRTAVFNDVEITSSTIVEFSVVASEEISSINVDYVGDGDVQTVSSTAVVDGNEGADIVPPETHALINGTEGEHGWYRSDVEIILEAADDSSGVQVTKYSFDGLNFVPYTNPIVVMQDGVTEVRYFSIDNAGNNEEVKSVEGKIDRKAPEFAVQFNTAQKKYIFQASDGEGQTIESVCSITSCTAKDEAGNTARIEYRMQNFFDRYLLSLRKIDYNGTPAPLLENLLVVKLQVSNGGVNDFDQNFLLKGQEVVRLDYIKNRDETVIYALKKEGGFSKETVGGIRFLQVKTDEGKINTSTQ